MDLSNQVSAESLNRRDRDLASSTCASVGVMPVTAY